jgi:8-oxo-dGTP pyrophosphatase MutT (NUDIX family)
METKPKVGVVGFLFTPDLTEVVLIKKLKGYDWMIGKYNGVGGKLEPEDHGPYDAMVREFKEETGCNVEGWMELVIRTYVPDFTLHVFYGVATKEEAPVSKQKGEIETPEWLKLIEVEDYDLDKFVDGTYHFMRKSIQQLREQALNRQAP